MPWQFRIAKLLYRLSCKLLGSTEVNRRTIHFAVSHFGMNTEEFAFTVLLCANGFDYWRTVYAWSQAWEERPIVPCERRNCIPDFVKRSDVTPN
jgi:hypothetical protein